MKCLVISLSVDFYSVFLDGQVIVLIEMDGSYIRLKLQIVSFFIAKDVSYLWLISGRSWEKDGNKSIKNMSLFQICRYFFL